MLTAEQLAREAAAGGFRPESFEKVARPFDVLAGLEVILPLSEAEVELLTRLNESGEIAPGLLTDDSRLADVLTHHPALLWKAQNVRKYKGTAQGEPEELGEPQPVED